MKVQITARYVLLALYLSRNVQALPYLPEPRGIDDLAEAVKKGLKISDEISDVAQPGADPSSGRPVSPNSLEDLNEAFRKAVRIKEPSKKPSGSKKAPWLRPATPSGFKSTPKSISLRPGASQAKAKVKPKEQFLFKSPNAWNKFGERMGWQPKGGGGSGSSGASSTKKRSSKDERACLHDNLSGRSRQD